MKRPRKGQIVVIDWLDICTDPGWLDSEEQAESSPAQAQSVGIVLSCDSKVLKLAHNVCLDTGKSDITAYPMGVIQKIRVLGDGKVA